MKDLREQAKVVAVLKEIKETIPTQRGIFNSIFRAVARFIRPKDETPIEKVDRLRYDDVDWKYIGRTIYHEEHGKHIDENDLPAYVDQLRQQHKREYPEQYPKSKTKK